MLPSTEKKYLQAAVLLACLVPLTAGLTGMLQGAAMLGGGTSEMDNHLRYLSGLLFAIGVLFVRSVPRIERYGKIFRVLTFLVVVGGAARLIGFLTGPVPHHAMLAALAMELVVTPALCLWQHRVARRFGKDC